MSNVTLQQLESLLDTLNQCESVIVSLKDENKALSVQVEQLKAELGEERKTNKLTYSLMLSGEDRGIIKGREESHEEITGLRAQIELMRIFLEEMHHMPTECTIARSIELHKTTSKYCLAEIKAQGIMEALSYAKEKCSTYLDVDFYAMEYANLLTDAAKGE